MWSHRVWVVDGGFETRLFDLEALSLNLPSSTFPNLSHLNLCIIFNLSWERGEEKWPLWEFLVFTFLLFSLSCLLPLPNSKSVSFSWTGCRFQALSQRGAAALCFVAWCAGLGCGCRLRWHPVHPDTWGCCGLKSCLPSWKVFERRKEEGWLIAENLRLLSVSTGCRRHRDIQALALFQRFCLLLGFQTLK